MSTPENERTVYVVDCETGEVTTETQDATADNELAQDQAAVRIARQRATLENVQVANTNETDWIIHPPSDTPANILTQIQNNLPGWQTFRQQLRALPILTIEDPTMIVWPTHPIRPATALTPPPDFLQTQP